MALTNFPMENSDVLARLERTNPFRAPGNPTPAQERLERATALAVTFLSGPELDVLAWQVELTLNLVLRDSQWMKAGDPASRLALLDVLEQFRQAPRRSDV